MSDDYSAVDGVGMNPEPLACYALEQRLVCCKCWCSPKVMNPEKITNDEMLTITVQCHGEKQTRMIEKRKLISVQKFFESEDGEV